MTVRKSLILKLGGSAIATKGDPIAEQEFYELVGVGKSKFTDSRKVIDGGGRFLRWEILDQLSEGILTIRKQVDDFIIVHGAGIFGHALVSHFLKEERSIRESIGWPKTILMVSLQNLYVVNWLQSIGIPAIPFPPHVAFEGIRNESSEDVVAHDAALKTELIRNILIRGYVPVLFGDMIIDKVGRFRVLSGDTILPILVRELGKVDNVVGVSSFPSELERDVAVYTQDPSNPNAKPIRKILVVPVGNPIVQLEDGSTMSIEEVLGSSTQRGTDVTGKMIAKVKDLIECARLGVPSRIVGPTQLAKALTDLPIGTKIIPKLD